MIFSPNLHFEALNLRQLRRLRLPKLNPVNAIKRIQGVLKIDKIASVCASPLAVLLLRSPTPAKLPPANQQFNVKIAENRISEVPDFKILR